MVTKFGRFTVNGEDMTGKLASQKRVFHNNDDCPIRNVVAQIGDRWSILVLFSLVDEPDRFNSIKRRVEGISQKMLTQTLRDVEREGYVSRTVYPEVPARVEYALTDLGRELIKPLYGLVSWADQNHTTIKSCRDAYDRANA